MSSCVGFYCRNADLLTEPGLAELFNLSKIQLKDCSSLGYSGHILKVVPRGKFLERV